jgi:hypothetical protein
MEWRMWLVQQQVSSNGRVIKYRIQCDERVLSFRQVITAWQQDKNFCVFYQRLLSDTPFDAYFFELPALILDNIDQPFECVLVDSPQLRAVNFDGDSFAEYFLAGEPVVSFTNLGRDAYLVAPTPLQAKQSYAHLAVFSRSVPDEQQRVFWQTVGHEIEQRLSAAPLWVSTSGLGVYWLHVRLDDKPKYYSYPPYKVFSI